MTSKALVLDTEGVTSRTHTTVSPSGADRQTYGRPALSHTCGARRVFFFGEACCGTIRTTSPGLLQAVTVHADSLTAQRTGRLAAQDSEHRYVLITLLQHGTARLGQDGRESALGPGDIFVCDMTRPFRISLPRPFRARALMVHHDMLGMTEPELARITALPLRPDAPLGKLLSPVINWLVDHAETYPPHVSELVARNAVRLLTALAEERLGSRHGGASTGNSTLLSQIKAFILEHLTDPGLSPADIARAQHISLRYLHKLFQSEGTTVRRWIQQHRLEACRCDLARHDMLDRTIAAVARHRGFNNAAHFSRMFRAAYGVSPTDWRQANALEHL
ncbi:helix-turn-helix domain-containing protein [Streptomyces sp. NPDC004629]|uniref:helix-turn-helix domain-containing protein n=1 Tax=Streptomyces sp. NPDC004629 TaxID=3364705 RepID=UPI00368DBCEC